jgi:hypothetical protein
LIYDFSSKASVLQGLFDPYLPNSSALWAVLKGNYGGKVLVDDVSNPSQCVHGKKKISRLVRCGREWKPEYGDSTEALSEEMESNGSAPPKSQAPFPDPPS